MKNSRTFSGNPEGHACCDRCGRRLRRVTWITRATIAVDKLTITENSFVGPTCRRKLINAGISPDSFKNVEEAS